MINLFERGLAKTAEAVRRVIPGASSIVPRELLEEAQQHR